MVRCMGCMAEMPEAGQFCPACGYAVGTPPREAYHLPPGTILQGRYIAGRVLGYGGFGVTYIGYDAALERVVAIKEFLPSTFATRMPGHTAVTVYDGNATQQFDTGLSRFVEEGQTLAQFNGIPGIVDIYDSFLGNNTAYIVMQFLQGQDVKEKLNTSGPLPYEEARDIVLKICDTLAPVHARGIIHRDISPDNIYLTAAGEVKLLDFGAARYESAVNSKSLSVILKSGYAPEEQYRSRGEQGPWTDVYALAASFYKMLTGQTPPDSMERAIQDELKEPSKLGAELPQSAENAILNALCVRKADRTKTVTDFKNALLSDGVERVKVKQTKAGTARVPVGARVAIAASAGVLVLLGLFTAAGGFGTGGIIGGTKLEDTYGSASRSGFVTVPPLAGMTLEEAEKTLEALGLSLDEEGYQFTDTPLDSPKIVSQTPSAGGQIEESGTVKAMLNMGEFVGAMEKGLVPSITGLSVVEAAGVLEQWEFRGPYHSFRYVYSDADMLGRVTGVELYVDPEDPGNQSYRIQVGCGPDDAPAPYGALRFAFLERYGDIRFVIASPRQEQEISMRHRIAVSQDGGANYRLLELYQHYGTGYTMGEGEENSPYYGSISLVDQLSLQYPEMAGKDLLFRLERYDEDTGEVVDSYDVTQTFRMEYTKEDTQVEAVELIGEKEAEALYEEGRFGRYNGNIERFFEEETEEEKQSDMEYYAFVRIKGNFTTRGYNYRTELVDFSSSGQAYLSPIECTKDGELVTMVRRPQFTEGDYRLIVQSGEETRTMDTAGNVLVGVARPAMTSDLPEGIVYEYLY